MKRRRVLNVLAGALIAAAITACGGSGGGGKGGLSGKWESTTEGITLFYEFSGKSYALKVICTEEMLNSIKEMNLPISGNEVTMQKGTYSISDDKIEFVLDEKFISANNGEKVAVFPFSRTENTFTMDGMRFTKK